MIKGVAKEETLKDREIYARTQGGYDIYKYYLGKVGKIMPRPWGAPEAHNSWGIFPWEGIWRWKDQATGESGSPIDMVMRRFGLDFTSAVMKICWDFGWRTTGGLINPNPAKVTWERPYEEKEYVSIKFSDKPFGKKHHAFWNIMEVSEDWCRKKNCFAVKDAAIKGKKMWMAPDEIVFAYYCPEEDAVKLYFPEREKSNRFRNNVTYRHLWGYSDLSPCEDMIVQKSCKDWIVASLIQPCCTATQAEAVQIFDEDTVAAINKISSNPWIFYGSDPDGVTKCKEITGTNNWRYVNTPREFLPEVNDSASLVKHANMHKMGTGLQALEDFLRHKGVI